MDAHWKRFPPEGGGLLLPLDHGRAAAAAALDPYAGCRPGARMVRRAATACVRLVGPARLPGSPEAWTPRGRRTSGTSCWRRSGAKRPALTPWPCWSAASRNGLVSRSC
jgi:hypothetical protein